MIRLINITKKRIEGREMPLEIEGYSEEIPTLPNKIQAMSNGTMLVEFNGDKLFRYYCSDIEFPDKNTTVPKS